MVAGAKVILNRLDQPFGSLSDDEILDDVKAIGYKWENGKWELRSNDNE